jgi:hypothetical protein
VAAVVDVLPRGVDLLVQLEAVDCAHLRAQGVPCGRES